MRTLLTVSLLAVAALGAAQSYRWDFDSTVPDNDPSTGTLLQSSGDPGGLLTVDPGADRSFVSVGDPFLPDGSALRFGWGGTAGSKTTPILSLELPRSPLATDLSYSLILRGHGFQDFVQLEMYVDGVASASIDPFVATDFSEVRASAPLAPGATSTSVQFYLYPTSGDPFPAGSGVDFDSMSYQATPEPSGMAALGLGAAATLARRRKRA